MSENQHHTNDASRDEVSVFKKSAFLIYVTLISGAARFGLTVARARKSAPKDVNSLNAEGTKLALKALGYGTAISVTGCGLLTFGVAKALGVSSVSHIYHVFFLSFVEETFAEFSFQTPPPLFSYTKLKFV